MRFANPDVLWLSAILLPCLAVFLVMAWRKKQQLIAQFVQSRLLSHLTIGVSHARQKLRLVLLFSATACALLALARPQWGFDWQEAHQQGLDVIVAIDTSKSMLAADISPNRLTRSKLAALDLMKLAKSDRLGVVAFAGTAFLQCPLTLDEEAFRQSIEALDAAIIPQGGTALAEAIEAAATAFEKSENHKVLVLFTDGEDQDSGAVAAAEKAAKANLKIFSIGVGTREGELLRIRDERGNLVYLKDDAGNAVKSRLNETLLQEIATKAGGFYLPLVGATPMEALYQKGLAPLPKSDSATKLVKNYREQYRWPLGLAVLILTFEMFLPQQRRSRKDHVGAAGTGLSKAVSCTIALVFATATASASISSAMRNYEAGKFAEAFADYQELIAKKTNDFRLYYNAGDAAYKAQQYDAAKKHFDVALQSPDLKLQQQAYYNLGNTLYEVGAAEEDPNAKREPWENAIHNYESALKLDPNDADAKHNLAYVKQKLEELKQQQQQQQENKQDQSKSDDEKQEEQQKSDQNSQEEKENPSEKQDNQKQDSAQQDQKDPQQQADQKQQEEQQQQQQQDPQQGQQQKAGEPKEGGSGEEEGQAVAAGEMSVQQALQFLEAQKQQDRTLIFAPPPDQKPKKSNVPLKDW